MKVLPIVFKYILSIVITYWMYVTPSLWLAFSFFFSLTLQERYWAKLALPESERLKSWKKIRENIRRGWESGKWEMLKHKNMSLTELYFPSLIDSKNCVTCIV